MSKVVNNEIQANSLADNKIQVKTPEVGDVWENSYGELAHIIYSDSIVVFMRKYWITNYEYHFEVNRYDLSKFLKKYTYLGKSIVKIEDLFKTENE